MSETEHHIPSAKNFFIISFVHFFPLGCLFLLNYGSVFYVIVSLCMFVCVYEYFSPNVFLGFFKNFF